MTAVAAVLALSLVSVPTVNLLTPLIIDRQLERVTPGVWLGSALIVRRLPGADFKVIVIVN